MRIFLKSLFFLLIFNNIFYCHIPLISNLKFDKITSKDGLPHNVIYCLFQDSRGFIWIGTQDGLSRYDGYEFVVCRQKPFDTLCLQDNIIQAIAEDKIGNIWIGTQNGGLYRFNIQNENFKQYKFNTKDKKSIGDNRIWHLYIDSKDRLIIGHNKGFDVYDYNKDQFERQFDEYSNKYYSVNCIIEDETIFWMGTWGDGLHKYDKNFKFIKKINSSSADGKSFIMERIKIMVKDNKGFIWIGGAYGGLIKFDPVSETYVNYLKNVSDSSSISSNYILSLLDCNDYLWIGTHDAGLNIFEKSTGKFYRNIMDEKNSKSISDNWVSALMKDKSGIIWIGTGNGISLYKERKQIFDNITKENSNLVESNTINCLEKDKDGNLWVGTWNGGLSVINLNKRKAKIYRYDENKKNTISSDIVWTLFEDKFEEIMYVGTYRGLNVFDYKKNKIFTFQEYFNVNEKLAYSNISALTQDSKGNLYIGFWGGGVYFFDKKEKKILDLFVDYELLPFIEDKIITSLFIDLKEVLWIGTNSGGLYAYDLKNGTLATYKNDPSNKRTISSNSIKGIYQDSEGDIWIGTNGGGINKFVPSGNEFISYTKEHGLPNNTIYNFIQDDQGYFWFSSNNGIGRFDKKEMKFLNFSTNDGLTGREFYNGIEKLDDGRIAFAALTGINIVDPKLVKINNLPPPIQITSLKVFNTEKYNFSQLNNNSQVTLSYEDKMFSITFATLDFYNSSANKYRYKLEGFDKEWIDAGYNRTAVYTNLMPGEYAFKVKGCNSDGVWNEKGVELFIEIMPPFYLTFWFVLLVVVLFLGSGFIFHKIRMGNIRKQNEILERIVEIRTSELKKINQELIEQINEKIKYQESLEKSERKLKELNASKDKFFSIISHDLKNPFHAINGLTTILTSEIGSLTQEEIKKYAQAIGESSKRLFELLQNLLYWASIQTGKIEPNYELLDSSKIFSQVFSCISLFAQERKVNVKYDKTPICFVGDKMMTILCLQNLVVNAIKFSYAGEDVWMKVEEKDDKVLIKVVDKGYGIKPEIISELFKIDSKNKIAVDDKNKGSGLGLILTKEFMKLQNGEILVESEFGKGSTFTLIYPKKKI